MESSRVDGREDLGQDFGWESVHRSDGVDGKPQLAFDAGELVCRVGSMDRNEDHGRRFAHRGFILGSECREVPHLASQQSHELING